MGKLQSFYAIRYYEMALSYRGFIGKEGNTEDEWFFEKTIDELRELFVLQEKYKVTSMFRINVIDNPVAELNAAKVGFKKIAQKKMQNWYLLFLTRYYIKNFNQRFATNTLR